MFPEIVTPALVLNLILCTVVQCSIKLLRESKVIVQDEQVLLVLSWMSDLGGFGKLGSWADTNGNITCWGKNVNWSYS